MTSVLRWGVGGQHHAPPALPPVWTGAENLAPTGIRSPDRPSRSESLYRPSYPGPHSLTYSLTYLLTYLLTPWSRALLEKLTVSQLVKIFPALYGTQRFITGFTISRHLSLSWATPIQSMPHPSHFLKIRLNIIHPSTLGSSKRSLSFRFPHQNPVYASPLSHTCYVPRPPYYSLQVYLLQ